MTPSSKKLLLLALGVSALYSSAPVRADSFRPFNPDATGGRPIINLGEVYQKQAVATVWNHADRGYVLIVKAESGARLPNDHPIAFTPEQMRAALSELRVQQGTGAPQPLFAGDALDNISQPLSDALAKAGPDEEIIFAAAGRQAEDAVTVLLHRVVTTGRIFYKDGRLNVILGLVKAHYQGLFGATGILRPYTPGSRNGPVEEMELTVIPAKGMQYAVAGRTDWIAMTPYVWSEKPAQEKAPAGVPAAPVVSFPAPTPATAPLAVPAAPPPAPEAVTAAASRSQPASGVAKAAPTPAAAAPAGSVASERPPATGSEAYYRRFEERLQALAKLRQQGLISAKEYQQKRRAILEEL